MISSAAFTLIDTKSYLQLHHPVIHDRAVHRQYELLLQVFADFAEDPCDQRVKMLAGFTLDSIDRLLMG